MAATLSKIGSATTLVNAALSTVVVVIIWPALYSALSKSGLLIWKKNKKAGTEAPPEKAE